MRQFVISYLAYCSYYYLFKKRKIIKKRGYRKLRTIPELVALWFRCRGNVDEEEEKTTKEKKLKRNKEKKRYKKGERHEERVRSGKKKKKRKKRRLYIRGVCSWRDDKGLGRIDYPWVVTKEINLLTKEKKKKKKKSKSAFYLFS